MAVPWIGITPSLIPNFEGVKVNQKPKNFKIIFSSLHFVKNSSDELDRFQRLWTDFIGCIQSFKLAQYSTELISESFEDSWITLHNNILAETTTISVFLLRQTGDCDSGIDFFVLFGRNSEAYSNVSNSVTFITKGPRILTGRLYVFLLARGL